MSLFTVLILLNFGTLCPVSSAHSYLVNTLTCANTGHKTKPCNLVSKLYEYHPVAPISKIAQGLRDALFLIILIKLRFASVSYYPFYDWRTNVTTLQMTVTSLPLFSSPGQYEYQKHFHRKDLPMLCRLKYRYKQNLQLALGAISIVTNQVGHKVGENPWNFKAWGLFSILGWNMETIGILWASPLSDKQVKCLSLSSIYWIAFRFKIQRKDGFSLVSMTISSHWSL